MERKKICFVAPNAYPLLQKNSNHKFMGGSELQQVLLGKNLAKNGYEVSFVTTISEGRKHDERCSDIKIYKAYERERGGGWFRILRPRAIKIWKAMKRADADIYYQRGANALTAYVALFCKTMNRTFIFSGAHDSNFMVREFEKKRVPHLSLWAQYIERKCFLWGIKNASHIFVQSKKQKQLLLKNYGLTSTVAYNVYEHREISKSKNYILWVGNIKKSKRPFLLLEIARKYKVYKFIAIGGPLGHDSRYYDVFVAEARKICNLEFLGFQPLEETEKYFNNASLLINTAEMEGFPNTFLQAWSRGIPTISFLDVDDIIAKNNLGVVVEGVEEIQIHLNNLMNLLPKEKDKIREYFAQAHSPEHYVEKIDAIVRKSLP